MRKFGIIAAMAALGAVQAQAAPAIDPVATTAEIDRVLAPRLPDLKALYQDLHANPELSFQEVRTAALLARRMRKLGFEVTEGVGGTGVVAVYRNGPGPVVLVRTELDGLPMEEKTGLPYASRAQQKVDGALSYVAHSCGHDMHMAWWIGSAETLLAMKDRWQGTLVFIAQPAEEIVSGAKAMIDAGLLTRFPRPDYGFAAHVAPGPAGQIGLKQGVVSSSSDSVSIRFNGVGAHGAMPDKGIDPIVQGSRFVTDVQTVISRQKNPLAFGVITVGAFNAGTVANIIPDHADLKLTLRSFDPAVRQLLRDGVSETARAAARMSRAPEPGITYLHGTASVINDSALTADLADLFRSALGAEAVQLHPESAPGGPASEDYSEFVAAGMTKSVFISVGGTDPKLLADPAKPVPVNHSPYFAPVLDPTLAAGARALTLAVLSVTGR